MKFILKNFGPHFEPYSSISSHILEVQFNHLGWLKKNFIFPDPFTTSTRPKPVAGFLIFFFLLCPPPHSQHHVFDSHPQSVVDPLISSGILS